MKIGLFINDLALEFPKFTTTLLAREAVKRGHQVCYLEAEDFYYSPDDTLGLRARWAPRDPGSSERAFLETVRDKKTKVEPLEATELDVLLLRNDPALDTAERPWAQSVGIIFGQMAARRGVLVLNDPHGLSHAFNKLYFQYFPQEVRPRTLITRDRAAIRRFIEDEGGNVVLKPIQGSGGQSVFLVRPDDLANQNQMIDAVLRDGYVIAQEYLPEAAEGDVRVFLLNGEPLRAKGKIAAIRRVGAEGDLRSNMHAGGRAEKVVVDERALRIAELVRPRLVQDGMFLVGLDIAGDKLMEVNVFSPGGLHSAQRLQKASFAEIVLDSLEHKVEWRRHYPGELDNAQLATL